MKKISILLIAVLVIGVLAGCGGKTDSTATDNSSQESVETNNTATDTVDTTDTAAETSATEDVKLPETIRVGVLVSTYIPYLTQSLGEFENKFGEDTKVELVQFTQGPPMVEALNSHELDIAFLGDVPAFTGLVNGGQYKIIGKYSVDTAKGLVVRKDSGINSLEDLKGHTYATPFGTNIQPLAELYLEAAGLTHEDVDYINLSIADINPTIISGDIDAAVTNEPNISKILSATDDVILLETAKGYKQFVGVIIAADEFSAEYGSAIPTFLTALQDSADWSHDNKEEAIDRIAEETGVDRENIVTLFELQDNNVYLTDEQVEALISSAAEGFKYELLTSELDVEKYIDRSYAETAGISK